jgi:hypothetical protein
MAMISLALGSTSSLAARSFSWSIVLDLSNRLTFASNFRSISSRFTGFSGLPRRWRISRVNVRPSVVRTAIRAA